MTLDKDELRKKGVVSTGFHLPYNPELVSRAKELRKNPTHTERKLWYDCLRKSEFTFLRQRPIDHFIVDFYCKELKLVIEIDGETHYTEHGKGYDKERTSILEGYGLKVIRFSNKDLLENLTAVCSEIRRISGSPRPEGHPP